MENKKIVHRYPVGQEVIYKGTLTHLGSPLMDKEAKVVLQRMNDTGYNIRFKEKDKRGQAINRWVEEKDLAKKIDERKPN